MTPTVATRALRAVLVGSWVVLPFAAGPALGGALDDGDAAVRTVASLGAWGAWGVVLLAVLLPRPVGLTALRVVAPAAVTAMAAAAVADHPSAVGITVAVVAMVAAFAPEIGASFVNGAAYPNETRHLLRAPGALLVGPLLLVWAAAVIGLAAGPLLLADRRWVAGALALAVGVPLGLLALRALHSLSRRWIVFVPAGLVLHDQLALVDAALFRRRDLTAVRPAPAGTQALDLTQRAPGLAVEIVLAAETTLVPFRPGRRQHAPVTTDRLLVTPTRPGRVLAEARERRLPLG